MKGPLVLDPVFATGESLSWTFCLSLTLGSLTEGKLRHNQMKGPMVLDPVFAMGVS